MLVIKNLVKAKQVQPPINGSLMGDFFHMQGIVCLRSCTSEASLREDCMSLFYSFKISYESEVLTKIKMPAKFV
jgi:hypothetical protein